MKLGKLHNDVQAALSHSILISISYMTQIYVDVSKSSILIPFFSSFQILVWHTRTEKTKLKNEERMKMQFGHGSDTQIEL